MSETLTPEKKTIKAFKALKAVADRVADGEKDSDVTRLELIEARLIYLEMLEANTKKLKATIFENDMQILISAEEIKKLLK